MHTMPTAQYTASFQYNLIHRHKRYLNNCQIGGLRIKIKKLNQTLLFTFICYSLLTLFGCSSTKMMPKEAFEPERLTEQHLHLPDPGCTLYERRVENPDQQNGPLIIAVNGVPTTSLIYKALAQRLANHLGAKVVMLDLPGTGGSRIDDGQYNWSTQRDCLRAYLELQPAHTLMLHDVAGPILLPIIGDIPNLEKLIVFNTLLKPSSYTLPFPMNCLRSCLFLSKPVAYMTPLWFYDARFRSIGIAREDQITREQINYLFNELRQDQGMLRLVDILRGFELNDTSDNLIAAGLAQNIPQLFIWGERDPVLGNELQYLKAKSMTRQIQILEQAKHFPMLDFVDESSAIIEQWYRQRADHPG